MQGMLQGFSGTAQRPRLGVLAVFCNSGLRAVGKSTGSLRGDPDCKGRMNEVCCYGLVHLPRCPAEPAASTFSAGPCEWPAALQCMSVCDGLMVTGVGDETGDEGFGDA